MALFYFYMAKTETIEADVILFGVEGDKDMRIEYPELLSVPEFAALRTKSELRFCWLVGNRTSPIFNIEQKAKVKKAMEIVYGIDRINRNKDLQQIYDYKNGTQDIPQHIFEGIERMTWYAPDNRLKAKLLSQYMFDTLTEMVVMNRDAISILDIEDKKKYAELIIKVSAELPNLHLQQQ